MHFIDSYMNSAERLFFFFSGAPLEIESREDWQSLELIRIDSFRLQSLGRIIGRYKVKKSGDQEVVDLGRQLRIKAKSIEDQLGQILYLWEMSNQLPFDTQEKTLAAQQLANGVQNFKSDWSKLFLQSCELIDSVAQLKLVEGKLKKIYLKGFHRELKKIHVGIKEKLDPRLLEDGTHELRRKLRWAIMGFIYPYGLFYYDQKVNLKKMSSYLKLDSYLMPSAVEVSLSALELLSQWVGQLGELKDQGLLKHFKRSLISSDTIDINQSTDDIIKITENCMEDIISKRPLLILRKNLSR